MRDGDFFYLNDDLTPVEAFWDLARELGEPADGSSLHHAALQVFGPCLKRALADSRDRFVERFSVQGFTRRVGERSVELARLESIVDVAERVASGARAPVSREGTPTQGREVPGHVEDIGIGIDEDRSVRVFFRRPSDGDAVRLKDARTITLPGKRWPVVLELLAESTDGRTASKADLLTRLGYCQAPEERNEISEFVMAGDTTIIKRAVGRLTTTMADLGRQLRDRLNRPGEQFFVSFR